MNAQVQKHGDPDEIDSAIHLEFIQNLAASGEAEDVEAVETYHRAIFMNHYARDFERLEQERQVHEDRLGHLESRLGQTREKLAGMDKLVPADVDGVKDEAPTSPWNHWDRAMFILALCGIASLLIFGVFNISFNLLESGIVTFMDHPIRAYFWAALLPVGALAVKVGWDFLKDRRKQNRYLWACLTTGILGVLVWVGAYASVYPTLSKTTTEHIESLNVFDTPEAEASSLTSLTAGGAKRMDMVIVSAQAVAEICLSAALGIFMTMIYMKHRPVRLARNPNFVQLDEDRNVLEATVEGERHALALARGNEVRLQNQLAVFVAYARSLYQKELVLRKDKIHQKQLLLDRIEADLRSSLESMEDGEGAGESGFQRFSLETPARK